MDPLPHQLEAVYEYFMKLPSVRFLLADDAGAGKTIMAGLLIRELKLRGLVERMLIVCPANLTFRWQREMLEKFDQQFVVMRGSDIHNQFGTNQWLERPQVITSLDLAKRQDILPGLEQVHWDLVIILKASSNEGDIVLDPFCGCATACVAADKLGRKWVGIDISPKAVELVNMRLQQSMGSLFHHGYVTARTDIEAPIPYRQNKHVLFGQQEGLCNGCRTEFPFRIFEVDHIIPQSRGGTDHLENLQLLCPSCNRIKGNRPPEYLMARLAEIGV